MFACELFDVVPDLIATAKGIAGGLPLAGVTGRAEIMEAVHVGGLGGTYGGNPVVPQHWPRSRRSRPTTSLPALSRSSGS